MSGTAPVELATAQGDSARATPTRTLAIIKTHALEHRMEIERRILEASFEIVKERQMEFDTASDQEFLQELFGRDASSLFEGPVWVYVLERRRAVEVWNALMGDPDPIVAKENSPNSLRALFGTSLDKNAFAGSPDVATAEDQITCLFQSSPPFRAEHDGELEGERSFDSEFALDQEHWGDRENPLSPSSSTTAQQLSEHLSGSQYGSEGSARKSSSTAKHSDPDKKVPFRARPLPHTTHVPDSQPRITKAAALRAGLPVEKLGVVKPRATPTKEELKRVFLDVPGHKRSSTIQVASTAPPVIAPRMTRAAALRIGAPVETRRKARPQSMQLTNTFEGVPGHKRRESISVPSVQAPTVAPRLNKSAELRARKDSAPPSSFMFRQPTTPVLPGGGRPSTSSGSTSCRPPSRTTRSSSSLGRQSLSGTMSRTNSQTSEETVNDQDVPVRPPSVASRPPSIEPRTNRSALLRAKAGLMSNTPGVRKGAPSKNIAVKVNRVVAV